MSLPTSTGGAARLLGVTEPQLNHRIRQRQLDPEPPVTAGRRLWHAEHLVAAALALGRDPSAVLSAAQHSVGGSPASEEVRHG